MSHYKMTQKEYKNIRKDAKIVFISAEFNRNFTQKMEEINENFLQKQGFTNIKKYLVPGAFEIPAFLKKVQEELAPDLVICFGVVIRGETTHYEMVASESARGIMDLSIKHKNLNVINAILTCENQEQVIERMDKSRFYAISGLNLLIENIKLKKK